MATEILLIGCRPVETRGARGPTLIAHYGCGSCHQIPNIPGAVGMVGPPLKNVAGRSYLAGNLPNTPENMVRWIRDPRQLNVRTVMPNMEIAEQEARDITAFLIGY